MFEQVVKQERMRMACGQIKGVHVDICGIIYDIRAHICKMHTQLLDIRIIFYYSHGLGYWVIICYQAYFKCF
jgi:hypothetical protein